MFRVLIEAERGSREKNMYELKTLKHIGRRQVGWPYPYPYGFIAGTTTAEGDGVDCFVITEDRLEAGTLVECEAIGLLEQFEQEELDHKVLASLPGQHVQVGEALLDELSGFIYRIFSEFPDATVKVGRILPKSEALDFISRYADR